MDTVTSSDYEFVLTIAIPTFNRPEELFRTVGSLVEQLGHNTNLLVIDNCSSEPAESVLEPFRRRFPQQIRIVRNRLNVGGTANILRCIEYADSPYVWLLGDDDLPTADCVAVIHKHIQNNPGCAFWKFSHSHYPISKEFLAFTAYDFLKSLGAFQQAIWISNGVFNRPLLTPYFAVSSHWSSSAAAHLLIVLLALEDGRQATLSPATIAEIKPPSAEQMWNIAAIFAGFPLLLEAPLKWNTKRLLGRQIGEMFGSPEGLALRVMHTSDEVWCPDEKRYHYRNLGNAIFRAFGTPVVKWRYAVLERCLAVVRLASRLDRAITGGKFLARPALSQPRNRL